MADTSRMREVVAITGANGFLGRHLVNRLADDYEVAPLSRNTGRREFAESGVARLVAAIRDSGASALVHAGFANRIPAGWTLDRYLRDAVDTTLAVVEATASIGARMLLTSSSAIYGEAPSGEPLGETSPIAPVSAYGEAKALQESCVAPYRPGGHPVTVVRLFNLVGPGQQAGMLVPDWIAKARDVVTGVREDFEVPHMRTGRDFVDVRDASEAVARLIKAPVDSRPVFNVCSGRLFSLPELHRLLETLAGQPLPLTELERNPSAQDVHAQFGSFDRIASHTGWAPTRTVEVSVRDAWVSSKMRIR